MKGKLYIITGDIQSGKTTRLIDWSLGRQNVAGIATPVVMSRRMFFDLSNQNLWSMESKGLEPNPLIVGKYQFSQTSFDRAISVVEEGIRSNAAYVVIDEIGPLELKGQGFADVLKKTLATNDRNFHLVLVIRERILSEVVDHFKLTNYTLWDMQTNS